MNQPRGAAPPNAGSGHRIPIALVALVLALWLGGAAVSTAAAQEPVPPGSDVGGTETVSDPGAPPPSAPVVVDGETLFRLRGVSAYPADRRAAEAAARIVGAARDASIAPSSLEAREAADESRIVAGDTVLVRVFDADAGLEGAERPVLTRLYLSRVRSAIRDYRQARTPAALLSAAGTATAATLALVLLFLAVGRGWRAVDRRLPAALGDRIGPVQVQSLEVVKAHQVRTVLLFALRLVRDLLLFAATVLWLSFVLGRFPWTLGAARQLDEWLLEPLAFLGRSFVAQVPNLLFLVVLVFLVRWLLRLIRLLFTALGRRQVRLEGFDAEWAEPTYRLVRLVVLVFALVVAYPYIPGSSSQAFKAISVFLGVLFSLGSSSFVANSLAGYTMIYRRAYREGDLVRIGEVFGVVEQIRVPVTRVRTLKNEEVVVPNITVLGSEVTNYSARAGKDGLILHTTVGIGYDTPWRQVEAMLLAAAARTEGLAREPAPFVLQLALGDFAVTYELNAHCHQPERMPRLLSALHAHVQDVCNEHGVQIMSPHYQKDPAQPKVVPPDDWYRAPARRSPGTGGGDAGDG